MACLLARITFAGTLTTFSLQYDIQLGLLVKSIRALPYVPQQESAK
jgi:hypothetical protein